MVQARVKHFKQVLADNESLETEFSRASEQDCRQKALQKQLQKNMIEHDIIAIADQRSTGDETLSIQYYNRGPASIYRGVGSFHGNKIRGMTFEPCIRRPSGVRRPVVG